MSLKPFHKSTSNLKFVYIMSRGRTILIFGHLLKTWLPGPDPDLKSDRCIYYNSERRKRSARAPSARCLAGGGGGVRGNAPP